jgi:hypothetical protein
MSQYTPQYNNNMIIRNKKRKEGREGDKEGEKEGWRKEEWIRRVKLNIMLSQSSCIFSIFSI